jgi:hypothetical protein
MNIPKPTKPEPPVLEPLDGIPDQAHRWILDEDGDIDVFQVEGDYHNGPRCADCQLGACEHCEPGIYEDVTCLREQADNRNRKRERDYRKAMERYEAQMDYWRELTGEAVE